MICSGFLTANHMLFTQRLDLISRPDAQAAACGVKITCARCSCFIHSKLCLMSFCNLSCSDVEYCRQLNAVLRGGSPLSLCPVAAARRQFREHFMERPVFKGHAGDFCTKIGWIMSEMSSYSSFFNCLCRPFSSSSACQCYFLSVLKTHWTSALNL